MRLRSLKGLLMLIALAAVQIGCLLPDSGEEAGTTVDMVPAPDPNSYVCDPLLDGGETPAVTHGVVGTINYLTDTMPRYGNLNDFMANALYVDDLILYFNQIFVPTRAFDLGFTTMGGQTIQTANGDTLYEYFGLKLRGRIELGNLAPGAYQFALLADDGANFYMDQGSGMEKVVDNDGTHATRMTCATAAVDIAVGAKIPYELHYYQGPQYHIALILMARPVVAGDPLPFEAECGREGNGRYFDSTQVPSAQQPAYDGLLARGWAPIEPQSFLLPEDSAPNPCNEPAPAISGLVVTSVAQTSVTLAWNTDRPATSLGFYKLANVATFTTGPVDAGMVQSHTMTITGLTANTDYNIYVRSASSSGLSSDSAVLNVRTRR